MTQKKALELVGIMVSAYPNAEKYKGNSSAIEASVSLWSTMFQDEEEKLVGIALKKHILTSKWPPSVAELREIMAEITRPDLLQPDESWALVKSWMLNTNEYDDITLTMIFPKIIAETIEACGGKSALLALSQEKYGEKQKAGLDKLTFIQLYSPRYQREKELAMIPKNTLELIQKAKKHFENPEYEKLNSGREYIATQRELKTCRFKALEERFHSQTSIYPTEAIKQP